MGNAKDQWDDIWMALQCAPDNFVWPSSGRDRQVNPGKAKLEREASGFDDSVNLEAKQQEQSAKEFLDACTMIEAILREARMATNDWRDEGTDANKRVESLLAKRTFWQALTILAILGIVLCFVWFFSSGGDVRCLWVSTVLVYVGLTMNTRDTVIGHEIARITRNK